MNRDFLLDSLALASYDNRQNNISYEENHLLNLLNQLKKVNASILNDDKLPRNDEDYSKDSKEDIMYGVSQCSVVLIHRDPITFLLNNSHR